MISMIDIFEFFGLNPRFIKWFSQDDLKLIREYYNSITGRE